MAKKDRHARAELELVPVRDYESSSTGPIRADIKAMVHHARVSFREDIMKVLSETGQHAAELEKAIGDVSQAEALQAVKEFFITELDRQLGKYS